MDSSRKENSNQIYYEMNIVNVKARDNKKKKTNDEILLELKKSLIYESKSLV